VPVEAQSYGKPVIAYGKGGILETVVSFSGVEGKATGVLFNEQTDRSLNEAIQVFEKNGREFDPDVARENVSRFNRDRFKKEMGEFINIKRRRHAENCKPKADS